ncbi:MAG: carbohydrate ABC transporter permease [Anaerolineae bacterium]
MRADSEALPRAAAQSGPRLLVKLAAARGSRRLRRQVGLALTYVTVTAGSVLYVIPFLWMVSTSLKTKLEAGLLPPKWIPYPPHFETYARMWTSFPFATFIQNTIFITLTALIGQLLSSTLVGYGFARLKFRGREFLFVLLLATMMLPGQVTMIPMFVVFRALGWVDTFKPLIVPAYIGGSPFYIFLMRQFIMTLPHELDDAARIDGCSSFRIYWNILMPLSKPAIATVAVFTFVGYWNDFMGPLIYLTSPSKMTLAVGLRLFVGQYSSDLPAMMAGSTISVLPIIVVYFLAQQYFVQGIALTGLKQ